MLYRIEVRPRPGQSDPRGHAALNDAAALHLATPSRIDYASVYFIEGEIDRTQAERLANELLADPLTQEATIGAVPNRGSALIEVHPLPGVMDPAAQAVELAIRAMLGIEARVQTGSRYDLHDVEAKAARHIAERLLANTVIHAIHDQPFIPASLPKGVGYELKVVDVPIRHLDDAGLERLSREGHLFLSLEEMKAIQQEYRRLGREPREIELETLAQTWSEHCVHKTLKATIHYREESSETAFPGLTAPRPGHELHDDGSVTIHNLLKSTVAAATNELMADGIDWCLSVFVDNAGIIAFDDKHAVCFKCETHNHPSAIEPYGGAATGIGGCIRDIIGTGLAARPIAATDIFCVAHPDSFTVETLPKGCLHPQRILRQVVAGVRDYGNRMGIPTLNGAVWFDDRYVGNPLVFCGVIGVMPRDKVTGAPRAGDHIIALGGRTGRDGIHGATFSSAELTDTHADEFSHAVQIGNALTEKQVLDAILEARDHEHGCLFSAITDCGAGGFSSAVGEMGEKLGATVHLDRAPLKYDGLSPTEIWISEAQERMVLAVPETNLDALRDVCSVHGVEMCDLGQFGTDDRSLQLFYHGTEVGRLDMHFMHDGIPMTTREAIWSPPAISANTRAQTTPTDLAATLQSLLRHPNIASKRWIIRQYDHEVQGGTVIKPIVGPQGSDGPGDAAVVCPVQGSTRGLAIGNGLATGLSADPYIMTLAAMDECVRNLVCVGADPERIAILDNFCWPSCKKPENLGALVRAAEACYDGAKAYRTPFISGKDSLNNQFTTEDGQTIEIPPTLLISGFGIVEDIERCITMDAKRAGNALVIVGGTGAELGGSHAAIIGAVGEGVMTLPIVDLSRGPQTARAVHRLVQAGHIASAHDCSEGGLLVAATEMAMAGELGLELNLERVPITSDHPIDAFTRAFAETPSRYLLEVEPANLSAVQQALGDLPHALIGTFTSERRLVVNGHFTASMDDLRRAFFGTLDW